MSVTARAPGRVNLIGEHTDYNDGFVLPCAIDRFTVVEAAPRGDRTVHVESLGESDDFSVDAIERTGTWRDYVRGVVRLLDLPAGASLRIESTVPRGAGLSSSASLEVAVGRALSTVDGERLALLAQRAENEFVGVQSGIMDQFAVTLARAGHALLLDCRDLAYRHIPIPDGVAIVVCDSHVERQLAASAYTSCAPSARRRPERSVSTRCATRRPNRSPTCHARGTSSARTNGSCAARRRSRRATARPSAR